MHAIGGHDTILGRGNITTYPARTSEEILNIHGVRKADMIITEAALPLMGGFKLCSAIRSDAGLKNVSIIMLCDSVEASPPQCREAGANAVLLRPFDPIQLFSKVSELLVIPQRQDLRTLLHVSVQGREKKSSFAGMSHNISMSGMLIETDQELTKGDRLTWTVNIGPRKISADGMVVRVVQEQAGGKFLSGIKFLNLDTKSLVIIEQFVKGLIKH